ncbi:MAG TPA: ATP-grasp domain-containing protein [Pedobacter sp.]|jgi:hypothetical protein
MQVYLVKSAGSESGTLETIPEIEHLQLIEDNELGTLETILNNQEKVCIISESSIANILNVLPKTSARKKAIEVLKDKYLFRELVKDDDFEISQIDFRDILKLNIIKKSIIKPLKGCFGTAVKVVDKNTDLNQLQNEIASELERNGAVFSENVLTSDKFIVEDYIEGQEYAVDMFYNSKGEPCIVNVFCHPEPKHEQYLHMVYFSSKPTFEFILPIAKEFFRHLNDKLLVTDFPMHCEFKLMGTKLISIEINPMRFGGMGLGNMTYHAFNVNPYKYFSKDKEPDWTEILKSIDEDSYYVHFIAYNSFSKDKTTNRPNLPKLRKEFTEIRLEQLFDYQKQLAFGIFCLRENEQSLNRLLQINFDDYFEPIL